MVFESLELDAYLQRIRLGAPLPVSIESLASITEAHAASIPFENLDILLGLPISLDLEALVRKLIHNRRGGYCFEHNTLMRAVLECLGYQVTGLGARVVSESGAMRPRTHMLLVVELPAGQYVVDVGFGGDGLLHPIALQHHASVRVGMSHHRLRNDGPQWVLEVEHDGRWTDLYSFDLAAQWLPDYEVANHFTSTHPSSPFVVNLTAQLVRRQRHVVLRNRTLTVREPGGLTTQTVRDPAHLLTVLEDEFGLAFPPGTRFRRPEF